MAKLVSLQERQKDHRLVYDYLERIYDRTFIYDAWSCRKGKGLLGAIERTACFLKQFATHTHTHSAKPFFVCLEV